MLLIALVVLLLSLGCLRYWSQRKRRAAVANLPGPYCAPLIGAIYLMRNFNAKSFLQESRKHLAQLGALQRLWVFNRLVIMSSDQEFNTQLLASTESSCLVKHELYQLMKPWLGNGLLLSSGRQWQQRRKIITPTFHFGILEQFVEVFDQQSNICVQRLAEQADGKTAFDVHSYVCAAALDIIAETAMGTKIYAQQAKRTPYADAVHDCGAIIAWRFLSIYLQNELLFSLAHPLLKLRQSKLINLMHEFTSNVIEQRRRALQQQQLNDSVDELGCKRRLALLDVLLQSRIDGRPLTNEEIREEVDTFMVAGHDTTTSALSFCLWLISRHAEVQAKLLAEILQLLGEDRSGAVSMRQLNELKYMECVIKETLRLYPSVPVVGRTLQADFKYTHSKFGAGVIPAGSEIIMSLILMQTDANYYAEPELFKPERFESSQSSAYAPFSAGPRNCVGQKFAQLEMKMLLAKLVREFELLPLGAHIEPVVSIVLRSATGFQLGMRRRQSEQAKNL
ncbi:Cyp316a1 [Drosophila busckii]|uniref:Cyp316a1 n=1 Tax=Drosophila busckii TaxID=30019 RepID=A0A0M4EJS0_DROBS|nr:Cyp316a1 [Drosophila busckii]